MTISVEVGRTPRGQRSYPLGFKVEFLQLWDAATVERGGRARLLREHGLCRATVRGWLQARGRGDFEASMVSAAQKSKGSRVDAQERAELARLRAENQRLRKKVEQAEAIQEIMGKAIELMDGITASSTDEEEQIPPALMSAEQYQQWLQRKGLS
ncbi:hypothetical protein RVF83_04120 [Gordonia rubripertincta]|uniref:Transposase n=2 Tax=Gordonia rubripertincta TaxID=36822 RepID=A0AAW6RCC0_GORRU|nr:hypothetical protein [Gordonia rubripertincta]MDG6783877.1 hypothetical protein [Gordonia rubripertincta]NKY66093.1 hypothetical protein [Gordonia rubripertincta]GAB83819.1 hypothetical protein GORBP_019_00020 [Gordonia rubripertincta NBRC 101908]